MASTVTSSTLTVKVQESLTLNGFDYGSTTSRSITGVNEIYKRIITVPVSGSGTIQLFDTTGGGASVNAGSTFTAADVKYVRISNLNSGSAEGVKLQFARDDNSDATDDEGFWLLLEEGQTMILNGTDGVMDAAAGDLDSPSLVDITHVRALNESGSVAVDLEIFIASA